MSALSILTLDNKGSCLHVGNRAGREQMYIHNIPINRVPHVRGERTPETAHEAIHLDECRS